MHVMSAAAVHVASVLGELTAPWDASPVVTCAAKWPAYAIYGGPFRAAA